MHPHDSEGILSRGPFLLFNYNPEIHPLPNQGELEYFTRWNKGEMLKLTAHSDQPVATATGFYLTKDMGFDIVERQARMTKCLDQKNTLIREFQKKHNLPGEY